MPRDALILILTALVVWFFNSYVAPGAPVGRMAKVKRWANVAVTSILFLWLLILVAEWLNYAGVPDPYAPVPYPTYPGRFW